jgi:hypothetical protein
LVVTLVAARFLGSHLLLDFLVATFAGTASVVLGYFFSEDWRTLINSSANRVGVSLSALMNRAKPAAPVKTNVQK